MKATTDKEGNDPVQVVRGLRSKRLRPIQKRWWHIFAPPTPEYEYEYFTLQEQLDAIVVLGRSRSTVALEFLRSCQSTHETTSSDSRERLNDESPPYGGVEYSWQTKHFYLGLGSELGRLLSTSTTFCEETWTDYEQRLEELARGGLRRPGEESGGRESYEAYHVWSGSGPLPNAKEILAAHECFKTAISNLEVDLREGRE